MASLFLYDGNKAKNYEKLFLKVFARYMRISIPIFKARTLKGLLMEAARMTENDFPISDWLVDSYVTRGKLTFYISSGLDFPWAFGVSYIR